MRTSKISQDTTRIFNALSPNARTGRTTRSAKRIASFALGYNGEVEVHENEETDEDHTHLTDMSPSQTPDIEDAFSTRALVRPRSNKKRKLGADSAHTATRRSAMTDSEEDETRTAATTKTKTEETTTTARIPMPRRSIKSEADEDEDPTTSPEHSRVKTRVKSKAKPKIPARKTTSPSGTVRIQPPSNWSEVYDIVKTMRQRNPTAPVDTMGCEELYWPAAPPREKRYHTLTALMLSSQTKDTVTAVAMHRLHTELVPMKEEDGGEVKKEQSPPNKEPEAKQSTLTIDNIIACDPKYLDHLIGKVGFHNNKTKYIKQVATILKEQYNSDIPSTVEGLVSLPGVGPKMAYLCMSAAWGRDEGIGVDVHVHRITNLWGWHKTKTPEETRASLESWLPRDKWHEINKMLVGLGQTVCLPVGRRCGECDLAGTGLCKAEIRGWKATQKKVAVKKEKTEVGLEADEMVVKKEEEEIVTTKVKEELVDS
ncbi:endonuclease III [Capronia coronata CBS 617.96]|uniref:Endonuclease III homolog n=1 Tax=Capronia coronata CBS 617.96 TaxID=1182541 RepID=W9YLT0_9EURO|nr:endonuclease III [Capronia coronata CBS 617.96]EXJ83229.1 endonuclease III [Capronia coronata CBS 617.96]